MCARAHIQQGTHGRVRGRHRFCLGRNCHSPAKPLSRPLNSALQLSTMEADDAGTLPASPSGSSSSASTSAADAPPATSGGSPMLTVGHSRCHSCCALMPFLNITIHGSLPSAVTAVAAAAQLIAQLHSLRAQRVWCVRDGGPMAACAARQVRSGCDAQQQSSAAAPAACGQSTHQQAASIAASHVPRPLACPTVLEPCCMLCCELWPAVGSGDSRAGPPGVQHQCGMLRRFAFRQLHAEICSERRAFCCLLTGRLLSADALVGPLRA